MLSSIIQFSIRNKLIIGLFTIGLIAYGAYEVTRLPIDAVPDITDNQVQVITITPALGAPDVERLITFPIEQANSSIPGTKEIRSFSRFGLSLVTIVFEDGIDIYWARQQVSERLQQVRSVIPQGIGDPELAPVTTGLGEIYQYVVRAEQGYEDRYSVTDLRTIQDWIIRRQLLGTPGVADVSSFGGKLKQYEVAVRQDLLEANGITLQDVFSALESNNQNTGGAYIERGPGVLFIRTDGLMRSIEDIGQSVIRRTESGVPLLVRDVAEIQLGSATRYGAMCYNDEGEVAGAVVMMLKGENSSAVIRQVKDRIAEIQEHLPEGVVIEPFLDRTKMVNNAIRTVETNLIEGALIVLFVLVFFLGNFRAGLLVASVIPLSMLFAIILMNTFGVGGNLMSLGAIDFGLIVDGAVILVEAIMHQLSHNRKFRELTRIDQPQMDKEVSSSTSRIMKSAVFGQIIILIVYLPILSLSGIEGKMFKPMAQTVSFAILGAFFLSLTYVPMMSALFLSKKIRHTPTLSDRFMEFIGDRYERMLARAMKFPRTIMAVSLGLLIAAGFTMTTLGGEFIPELEEGDFAVDTRVLTGSNLETTIAATQKTAQVLLDNFPEVEKVVTKIGSGEIPTDPMPIEASDMMVILKDKKEWTSARSFDELAEKMSEKLADIPGVTSGFQFPVQMRFNELMTGARQDVVCKIFGEDLDTLASLASRLGEIAGGIDGARDLYVENVTGMPQVVIRYRRDEIARLGVDIALLNDVVNTAFAGQSAGIIYEGEKRFDLVVRLSSDQRNDVADIRQLRVPVPGGWTVPLSQLAEVEVTNGVNQIQRENTHRRIIVGFNVRGRDVQTIVQELQQHVKGGLSLPPGYSITYGGTFENLVAAKERLSIAVPVALLLIFLMLYFAFGSVSQGLLIYSAIPLSAIGGIFALKASGMAFSISAGIGFIALFGVAVLNGIVLIAEFNRLRDENETDLRVIALKGTRLRLRSVLMTALAPSLGFIPMAVSQGAGAEVQRPLALVVIGGLVTATILTLFVLPILYTMFSSKKRHLPVHYASALAALVILAWPSRTAAQTDGVTLDAAIEHALRHNLSVKGADLRTARSGELSRVLPSMEYLQVTGEYGNVNSAATDNRFALSHSFSMPGVYRNERREGMAWLAVAQASGEWERLRLRQEVKASYFRLLVWEERIRLATEADSLYAAFRLRTAESIRAGALPMADQAFADQQALQARTALLSARSSMESELRWFNWLLNGEAPLRPIDGPILYPFLLQVDSATMRSLPAEIASREAEAMGFRSDAEKAAQWPRISVGYYNMTIRGWQNITGEDEYYDDHRFQTVTAGIELPLFRSPARQSRAAELQKQETAVMAEHTAREQDLYFRQLLQQYTWLKETLDTYSIQLAEDARLVESTASRRLEAGDIDLFEWVFLVDRSLSIRSSYLDLVEQHNEIVFQIESFIPQP